MRIAIGHYYESKALHFVPSHGWNDRDRGRLEDAFQTILALLPKVMLDDTFLRPDASTQTDPAPTTSSVGTQINAATTTTITTGVQTDAATTTTSSVQTDMSSRRTYADALIQTTSPTTPQRAARAQRRADSTSTVRTREQNSTSSMTRPPAPLNTVHPQRHTSNSIRDTPDNSDNIRQTKITNTYRTRAYVIHGVPLNKRLWQVREELEKREGRRLGRVEGIRWLLRAKGRRGKEASSVVIYLESAKERPPFLWVGYRRLRVDIYDFDRGRDIDMGEGRGETSDRGGGVRCS